LQRRSRACQLEAIGLGVDRCGGQRHGKWQHEHAKACAHRRQLMQMLTGSAREPASRRYLRGHIRSKLCAEGEQQPLVAQP
jgi:hypothetical protein